MEDYGFERIKICEKIKLDGVPVLNISVSFSEYPFFRELAGNAAEWAKNILYPSICDEYMKCSDPRKRFSFGYNYSFECKACYRSGDMISVKIKAALKKRAERHEIASNNYGLVIRESDGIILPIEAIADRKTVKEYRKIGAESFCMDGNMLTFLSNNGEKIQIAEVREILASNVNIF